MSCHLLAFHTVHMAGVPPPHLGKKTLNSLVYTSAFFHKHKIGNVSIPTNNRKLPETKILYQMRLNVTTSGLSIQHST